MIALPDIRENPDYYSDLLSEMEAVAEEAGEILLDYSREPLEIEHKGRIDLVTGADRASEKHVIERLQSITPDIPVLAEEGSGDGLNIDMSSGHYPIPDTCWLVDPLDGTTNFAHGFPWWSVSIALWHKGETIAGVVYNPCTGDFFRAVRDMGAYRGSRPIVVSKADSLENSLLATGFPYDRAESDIDNMRQFSRLITRSQGIRRCGSAALDLCFVACGWLDGYWEFKLKPWDMAAGALIVEEAGGLTGAIGDGAWSPFVPEIIAAGPGIYEALWTELSEA